MSIDVLVLVKCLSSVYHTGVDAAAEHLRASGARAGHCDPRCAVGVTPGAVPRHP